MIKICDKKRRKQLALEAVYVSSIKQMIYMVWMSAFESRINILLLMIQS